MACQLIKGNIFCTKAQTIVNTVNCVGVMGAGIALECRLRYPGMFQRYQEFCKTGAIDIGKIWLYKSENRWILNFPTKKHWKHPSKERYLKEGLEKFSEHYARLGIKSIAFPLLGASHGGLSSETSLSLMRSYLNRLDLDIEIYEYDPMATDDLYERVKEKVIGFTAEDLSETIMTRKSICEKVIEAFSQPDIVQLNQIGRIKGIGIKTLEKVFNWAIETNQSKQANLPLLQNKSE